MNSISYSGGWLTPAGVTAPLAVLLAFPLAGAITCALWGALGEARFGRASGGRVAPVIAILAMLGTLAAAVAIVCAELLPIDERERWLVQPLWSLFTAGNFRVTVGLAMDPLAAVMVLLVTGLGTLIHVFAAAYMDGDPGRPRFFAFLNLFVFSMLLLVLADGFVALFFGWEGVGVCSYFLIGFWYQRRAAADAAMKAFIVNRVGDFAFLLGIALLLWGMGGIQMVTTSAAGQVGTIRTVDGPMAQEGDGPRPRMQRMRIPVGPTLSFRELRDQLRLEMIPRTGASVAPRIMFRPATFLLDRKKLAGMPFLFVVCVLLFLGAAGKSAQIPLFAWLPDAMAGPTPVSALIHAATMVTAGVYLLARLSFLFALSPGALTVVAVIGTLTALVGATAALAQTDLKRVLAYSTVSQLGYMFVAIGAGAAGAGVFHVVTHGFFKACLFLAAGIVIHAVAARSPARAGASDGAGPHDGQDLRRMGGLAAALPWTRRGYFCACAALGGLPFASGFYSKDQILTALASTARLTIAPSSLLAVLALTAFLTSLYAFRTYYLIFYGRPAGAAENRREVVHAGTGGEQGRGSRIMTVVVVSLGVGALGVGPLLGWPSNWLPDQPVPVLQRFLAPLFDGDWPTLSSPEVPLVVAWGMQAGGLALAVLGFVVARALYRDGDATSASRRGGAGRFARAARFFASGWGFDRIYRGLGVIPVLALARAATWFDRRILDRAVDAAASGAVAVARLTGAFDKRALDGVVDGVSGAVLSAGRRSARMQSGRLNSYVLGIAAGVAALVVLAYFLTS